MKQATLIAPEGWTVLKPAEQNAFIQAEFGQELGRNILAVARKNGAQDVFALLEYRQTGYIENPSLQQINEQVLIQKANEDLQMMNQENGFSEAEKVHRSPHRYDSAWNYRQYNPNRDRKAEGTLANLMLMNRFI